jgi:hypothetical protein
VRHAGRRLVVALDLLELCEHLEIGPEASERLEESADPLRRGVENAIARLGIVVAVTERPVRPGV